MNEIKDTQAPRMVPQTKAERPRRINVTRSSLPPLEEYVDEIRELWDTRWLTNHGSKYQQLTEQLRVCLDTPHLALLVNGHMALEMTLAAMELKGEVITTPYTFASTTHAIVNNGLKPVFCDINQVDYTINADKIESLITEKTSAIVATHVYGSLCDVDKIGAIAKKHGLKVIYDAAHTFGVKKNGFSAASFGDAAMISLHATKVFHTIEGGIAVGPSEAFIEKLQRLTDFGITDEEHVDAVGVNGKMNEFCAAMGLCNLRHLPEETARRKAVFERYQEHLEGVQGIRLQADQIGVNKNYIYMPVVFDGFGKNRDQIQEELGRQNIYARKYFYPIMTDCACYAPYSKADVPVARYISRRVLTLPMYSSLSLKQVDEICKIILT